MSGAPDPPTQSRSDADVDRTYAHMRALARHHLRGEKRWHTLQPTALAHEAWIRLLARPDLKDADTRTFQHAASLAMRRVLIDHARQRGRVKRDGGWKRVPLDALELAATAQFDDLLAIDDAIERLAAQDPHVGEVVRLRFFSGLDVAETAAALSCSERTVVRESAYARAWILRHLRSGRV